jgi:hypothetical protein
MERATRGIDSHPHLGSGRRERRLHRRRRAGGGGAWGGGALFLRKEREAVVVVRGEAGNDGGMDGNGHKLPVCPRAKTR